MDKFESEEESDELQEEVFKRISEKISKKSEDNDENDENLILTTMSSLKPIRTTIFDINESMKEKPLEKKFLKSNKPTKKKTKNLHITNNSKFFFVKI